MSERSIKRELQLNASSKKAFDVFVNQFSNWWPSAYTWSQDSLKLVTIEPKINGRCYEEGPHGFTCQFGRVLDLQNNKKIVFTWQIGPRGQPQPDPKNASEISVSFIEINTTDTTLVFEHSHIERHGEGSQKYFDELNSEYGWDFVLSNYSETLQSGKPT